MVAHKCDSVGYLSTIYKCKFAPTSMLMFCKQDYFSKKEIAYI